MLESFQVLGCSAGIPTQERGVTSLLVTTTKYDIMLDCGEGTYLKWLSAGGKWRRLKTILITHMHPDHTAGLIPLIFYRKILRIEPPLTLYGPPNLEKWLLKSLEEQGVNLTFELIINSLEEFPEFELADGITVTTAEMKHKIPCWGFRLEDVKRSFVFVTDTLPCDNAVKLAQNADVLLHESTFKDEHHELAEETKHTTFSQAVKLSEDAGARDLYLTHYSPRIDEEELFSLSEENNFRIVHPSEKISLK